MTLIFGMYINIDMLLATLDRVQTTFEPWVSWKFLWICGGVILYCIHAKCLALLAPKSRHAYMCDEYIKACIWISIAFSSRKSASRSVVLASPARYGLACACACLFHHFSMRSIHSHMMIACHFTQKITHKNSRNRLLPISYRRYVTSQVYTSTQRWEHMRTSLTTCLSG
jgi:hypothetical protein